MRSSAAIAALSITLLAGTAVAQVHLVVRADGRKVISNFGAGGGRAHRTDYKWLAARHDRRSRYDKFIESSAARWDVDPVLVRAVIQVESDFDPTCLSNKGARGLMQLIPETARRYGVKNIFDPQQNIDGGVHYLADLLEMFHDDLEHALAAYNAGEGAVTKYAGIPPYEETTTYVKRALTVYYGRPYGGATAYAGGTGGRKLKGGFGRNVGVVAATMLPGVRYLGTR
jgi:soluble lytic murein transglycosylase-like protein